MLVTMSDKEISRINVIQSVVEKRMRRRDAAHQLALTERQTQRLMNRFRESGAAGLVNLRRGRPGNHRLPESLKLRVLSLLHDHYSDFGPTLAAEKLRERHNITVSVETLRKWMTADGLWVPYSRRRPRVHQPRYRRDCLGELVQIDFSEKDLALGVPMMRAIDKGLANSRIGLVLVTPALLNRLPKEGVADKELSALLAGNQLVPIVHNTTYEALRNVSPLLASRSGLDTGEDTLAVVATKIAELITV